MNEVRENLKGEEVNELESLKGEGASQIEGPHQSSVEKNQINQISNYPRERKEGRGRGAQALSERWQWLSSREELRLVRHLN